MCNYLIAPSYARAQALIAAGCPLDFPGDLPGRPAEKARSFYVDEPPGYAQSSVFALSPYRTAYVITLRLGTYRASGTVIDSWSFDPPWGNHVVDWGYELSDVIPRDRTYHYKRLLGSGVKGILNDRSPLARGRVVDGLLCGVALQPIGKSEHGWTSCRLNLTDDGGNTVSLRISLSCAPSKTTSPALQTNGNRVRRRITHEETLDPPRPRRNLMREESPARRAVVAVEETGVLVEC